MCVSDELSVHTVLRLALRLSRRAQLEVFEQLGAYLAETGEPESRYSASVRRQREALLVMERVAEAADCPPGKAPTRTQFAEQAPALGITLSVSSIGRAFGSWANAQAAYERSVPPETARQVRQRKSLSAHRERSPVEHLALFHAWADQADDLSRTSYERWRKQYAVLAASEGLPVPLTAQQLLRLFPGIGFEELVELRHTATDLTELVRARVEATLAAQTNPLGLVTVAQAAALISKPETFVKNAVHERRPAFPVMAARVGGAVTLRVADVREYARTGRAPRRTEGELQEQLYDRQQAATKLGISKAALDNAVLHGRKTVPAPDGQVGRYDYWLRSTVEAWTRPDKDG